MTVDDRNRPNTRNVVLRDFSIEDLTVRFHTDKRSSKIQDIKVNRDVCLIGYDKRAKLQIRIDAEANAVEDEKILMDIWHKMYPMSRECYRVSKSPGEEIGNPASIISIPISSNTRDIWIFSSTLIDAPGDCSPSLIVVSKIKTFSLLAIIFKNFV